MFERDGFVHCCTREHIVELASWWFGKVDDLVVLEIDPAALTSELVFEESDTRWFPHVFGPIDRSAVVAVHEMPKPFALPAPLASPTPGFTVDGLRDGREVRVRWCGGALSGDDDVVRDAQELLDKGERVPVFGGVDALASSDTPYGAFCLIQRVLDEVVRYHGDGFEPATR